jgi:hypothetical protein
MPGNLTHLPFCWPRPAKGVHQGNVQAEERDFVEPPSTMQPTYQVSYKPDFNVKKGDGVQYNTYLRPQVHLGQTLLVYYLYPCSYSIAT